MDKLIEVRNIFYKYPSDEDEPKKEQPNVLFDVSFEVARGEFIAIIGQNGSGKSTLAKMLNGLTIPDSGEVLVDGMSTADEEHSFDIRCRVGLVLQNPDNQLVTSIVEEDVAFAPENLGIKPREIRERVDSALRAVGMYEYRRSAVHKLSGGQKQRVAIAGILAMKPECIVLDEPTAMLDPRGRQEVMTAALRLREEQGISIILISHYMQEAALADRIIVMDKGEILTQGTPEEVFSRTALLLSHKLSAPQSSELIYRLRRAGFMLPDGIVTDEDCASAILKLIKEV